MSEMSDDAFWDAVTESERQRRRIAEYVDRRLAEREEESA